jgi:hypothetical protein
LDTREVFCWPKEDEDYGLSARRSPYILHLVHTVRENVQPRSTVIQSTRTYTVADWRLDEPVALDGCALKQRDEE